MISMEFDPLAVLEHLQLQNIQHNQNMLAISEHLVTMTQQITEQHTVNLCTQRQITQLTQTIAELQAGINKQAGPVA